MGLHPCEIGDLTARELPPESDASCLVRELPAGSFIGAAPYRPAPNCCGGPVSSGERRPRSRREVVFVDGVRTPFSKAGPKGVYAETRADELVVRVIRELLRRNPALPADRIDEVAIAATTQVGDQGLTIGGTAALLAGMPTSVH